MSGFSGAPLNSPRFTTPDIGAASGVSLNLSQQWSSGPSLTNTSAVSLANGANVAIQDGPGRGFIVVSENFNTGQAALILLGDGSVSIVAQTGSAYVVGSTPAAGKIGVAYDAGTSTHRFYNNFGSTIGLGGLLIRTG